MNLYPLIRKILFLFDAETAHNFSLRALSIFDKMGLLTVSLYFLGARSKHKNNDRSVDVMGLHFKNPVGLAAGLDKNACYINALAKCGFGFIEVGTVTPIAQPGNHKPRMFRLQADHAIINRMGFNNGGVKALVKNVKKIRKDNSANDCLIGINIGKNKNTPLENAVDDYLICLQHVYACADYVTINISSPNTPGLRTLQHGKGLEDLLEKLKQKQLMLSTRSGRYVPLLVKIAPDLEDIEIRKIAQTLIKIDIDGVIVSNTSNQRPDYLVEKEIAKEEGGLSGAPLVQLADEVLVKILCLLNGKIPVIAVGGIMSAYDAEKKLQLGASLVQVYSGFIYTGPSLIQQCLMLLRK